MLTAEEFSLFRNLIYQESGMYFADTRKEFLEYRIMKRMKATATATPYWYYRFVAEHRQAELPVLLESMTINETSFFRNMPQFELLRRHVLPRDLPRGGLLRGFDLVRQVLDRGGALLAATRFELLRRPLLG
jgi:chemotaxis protein methyltransferase CheR